MSGNPKDVDARGSKSPAKKAAANANDASMQAEEVQVILKTKEQREKEQSAAVEPKKE